MADNKFNAIDLFAGCGGLSLGLSNAGFNVILANEIHEDAARTYEHNLVKKRKHNTKIIVDDICNVTTKRILDEIGKLPVHLITAGPPCQGFSMAGRREMNDPRNQLFKQLLRIVDEIKPPIFIMENVKGILTMDEGKVIQKIKSSFEDIGYTVRIKLLNAADYGVPQRRERVFIIGTLLNEENLHPPKSIAKLVNVKEAIDDLSFLKKGTAEVYKKEAKSAFQKLMRKKSKKIRNHETSNHSLTIIERFSSLKPGQTGKDLPEHLRTKKQILWRMDPTKPSRTITTLPDDYIHYKIDRTLTVREMARLQSFPDDFEFLGARSTGGSRRKLDVPQYSQVGNAVPPLLAEAVGKHLFKLLSENSNFR